jgi:DNA repair protein RecN (Recombination protein N)
MEELRSRNDELQALLFKHQLQTSEELIHLKEDIGSKLEKSSSLSEEITNLEKELESIEERLKNTGLALRESRENATEDFSIQVISLLRDLRMPDAKFLIEISPLDHFGPNGMDKVEFLFSANAGSEPGKIKNVASGGELSRLALCIKHLVAGKTALPTMIFDEIDSGVSGDVALKMGHILFDMATRHQILVITHAPQIAALGERHYFVYKEKEDDQTFTRIKILEGEERVMSIASMLSSSPPSKAAINNAKDLLKKNL